MPIFGLKYHHVVFVLHKLYDISLSKLIKLATGRCCGRVRDREVDETDDNTLSIECVNSPRSRLVTAPATECFRLLPSSAEVGDVLRTARYRHRTIACLRCH